MWRVAAGIVFGILTALSVGGWFGVNRGRRRLEVRSDAIVGRRLGVKGKPFTLTRAEGDTLRILPRFKMLGAVTAPRLMFLGRGGFIELPGFSLDAVRGACEAQGWRFDGDPSLAVRDVQDWLHWGRSVEAAQLIELFGPFPAAARYLHRLPRRACPFPCDCDLRGGPRRHVTALEEDLTLLLARRNLQRFGRDALGKSGDRNRHRAIESIAAVQRHFELAFLARVHVGVLGCQHQVRVRFGRMRHQLIGKIFAGHLPEIADLHLVAAGFGERVGDAGILIELRAGEVCVVIDGDLFSVLIEDPQDGVDRRAKTLGSHFKDQLLVFLHIEREAFRLAITGRPGDGYRRQ